LNFAGFDNAKLTTTNKTPCGALRPENRVLVEHAGQQSRRIMSSLIATQSAPELVLAAAIDTQRRAVLAVLDAGAERTKAKPVHALRVAIRRLASALQLARALGYAARPKTLRRLRKLMSALSGLRDAQQQRRAIERLSTSAAQAPSAIVLLRETEVDSERQALHRLGKFDASAFDLDISSISERLATSVQTPDTHPAANAVVLGELAKRHLEALRQQRRAGECDAEALHRARLVFKNYRYALEAIGSLLPASACNLLEASAELQDSLGHAHDAHVLAETLSKLAKAAQTSLSLQGLAGELAEAGSRAHEAGKLALGAIDLRWPFTQTI